MVAKEIEDATRSWIRGAYDIQHDFPVKWA
jgi:hypothetical protein